MQTNEKLEVEIIKSSSNATCSATFYSLEQKYHVSLTDKIFIDFINLNYNSKFIDLQDPKCLQ